MRAALILALLPLLAFSALAAPPSTCAGSDDYSRALCAYQRRQFPAAEAGFRALAEVGTAGPNTMKARYFLARTLMKTGRFPEAADLLIRIYGEDKPFYRAWNCDFLLGECRKALGKS